MTLESKLPAVRCLLNWGGMFSTSLFLTGRVLVAAMCQMKFRS